MSSKVLYRQMLVTMQNIKVHVKAYSHRRIKICIFTVNFTNQATVPQIPVGQKIETINANIDAYCLQIDWNFAFWSANTKRSWNGFWNLLTLCVCSNPFSVVLLFLTNLFWWSDLSTVTETVAPLLSIPNSKQL